MAQNKHCHFKREEWGHSEEILDCRKTETSWDKQAKPVAPCLMSGTFPSKGLDGLTFPALLSATAHSLVPISMLVTFLLLWLSTMAGSNLEMSLFWLTIPEGKERVHQGRGGLETGAWSWEITSSMANMKLTEQPGSGARLYTLNACPRWCNSSFNVAQ